MSRVALLSIALFALAATASATTLSFPSGSCDTMGCQGSALKLKVKAGTIPTTWDIVLTIDTTSYTGGLPGISQVGFGAITGWSSVSLLSFTSGTWGTPVASSLNNNPCTSGMTNQHKVCVTGYTDIMQNPGAYSWTFQVVGGTMLDVNDWHIGAHYNDASLTSSGNIISAHTPAIPEPSAALVFAAGLGVVGGALRRARPSRQASA